MYCLTVPEVQLPVRNTKVRKYKVLSYESTFVLSKVLSYNVLCTKVRKYFRTRTSVRKYESTFVPSFDRLRTKVARTRQNRTTTRPRRPPPRAQNAPRRTPTAAMPCFAPLPRVLAPPRRAAARGRGRVRAKTAREDEAARRRRTTTPSRRRAYRARTCARTAPTNDLIEALEGRALTRAGDGEDADAIDAEASAVAGCGDAELVETLAERARELTGPEVSNLQYNVQYLIYTCTCTILYCVYVYTYRITFVRKITFVESTTTFVRKYESTKVLSKVLSYESTKVRKYFRTCTRTCTSEVLSVLSYVYVYTYEGTKVLSKVLSYFRTFVQSIFRTYDTCTSGSTKVLSYESTSGSTRTSGSTVHVHVVVQYRVVLSKG